MDGTIITDYELYFLEENPQRRERKEMKQKENEEYEHFRNAVVDQCFDGMHV